MDSYLKRFLLKWRLFLAWGRWFYSSFLFCSTSRYVNLPSICFLAVSQANKSEENQFKKVNTIAKKSVNNVQGIVDGSGIGGGGEGPSAAKGGEEKPVVNGIERRQTAIKKKRSREVSLRCRPTLYGIHRTVRHSPYCRASYFATHGTRLSIVRHIAHVDLCRLGQWPSIDYDIYGTRGNAVHYPICCPHGARGVSHFTVW